MPPDATAPACLDTHGKTLSALPGDVVFAWVVFTGHGNPGRFSDGGYSVFDLPTLSNPKSSQVLFLEQLNRKCSEHTIIDLRLCNIARGADGERFLIKFSELTGCRVIGYTDVYAVLPHGDAYMAHPSGRYELIESFPPYKPYRPFGSEVPEQVPVEVLGRGSLPGEPGPRGIPSVPRRAENKK